jgi:hypothetical protein
MYILIRDVLNTRKLLDVIIKTRLLIGNRCNIEIFTRPLLDTRFIINFLPETSLVLIFCKVQEIIKFGVII